MNDIQATEVGETSFLLQNLSFIPGPMEYCFMKKILYICTKGEIAANNTTEDDGIYEGNIVAYKLDITKS